MIKIINNYFFGADEIDEESESWFYGFLIFMCIFTIFLIVAKINF